ncbi:hypothetical protein [Candidatus Solincola tengchongensis]|uniref:hypothetical protein n=1 Tax=Candidatus Solincola tengchongensis TaxID=2900693 RepID=UPI00257E9653|nr:hypothetical protein [Candidatus Solincola tengchongensis]
MEVPDFPFLMVDGKVETGKSPATCGSLQKALEALYGISHTLKFIARSRPNDPFDFKVMPL